MMKDAEGVSAESGVGLVVLDGGGSLSRLAPLGPLSWRWGCLG